MSEQEQVTVELVERKIATYVNVGTTIGPRPIIDLLRSRCTTNAGEFLTPEEVAAKEAAAEEARRAAQAQPPAEEPEEQQPEEPEPELSWQNGMVSGLTGTRVGVNGVLDLRGIPAEQLAKVEVLRVNGVVLLDEANRSALSPSHSQINGITTVAPPDMRVIIQPDVEFSKASVEAMAAGQKLMVIGNIFFRPDVPPALAAEKFERLNLVGITIMTQGVQGALLGRVESTGISITIPDDAAEVVRSMGNNTWTVDYLSRLPDNTVYVNVGNTTIP
jgi:hypothetical protein